MASPPPLPDPLEVLLRHASSLDTALTFSSSSGDAVGDLLSAAFLHLPAPDVHSHSSSPHSLITYPRSVRTRVLRSRNSPALHASSLATPGDDAAPDADDFLPLDALVFLLQTQSEAGGLYAVKATREKVARVDTLDRPSLLDFLTGRKHEVECEVVLSRADCQARERRRQESGGGAAAVAPLVAAEADNVTDVAPADAATTAAAAATATAAAPAAATDAPLAPTATAAAPTAATLHPLLAMPKRPYAPSKQDAAFVKRLHTTEVVLRDRTWAFRCVRAGGAGGDDDGDDDGDDINGDEVAPVALGDGKAPATATATAGGDADFTLLRKSVAGRIATLRKGGGGGRAAPSTGPTPTPPTSSLGRSAKHRRLDPIIILPSSPSSLLTLSNIKRFLEEGHFEPPSSSSTLAPTGGSNEVVVIARPSGNGRFLAIDSLDALQRLAGGGGAGSGGGDPWRRVLCVITTGQKWQFRGYRWEEGRELFKNVFGAYPRYSNAEKDRNVREWNVTELVLDPGKRHLDRQVSAFFWRMFEGWVGRRRPEFAA